MLCLAKEYEVGSDQVPRSSGDGAGRRGGSGQGRRGAPAKSGDRRRGPTGTGQGQRPRPSRQGGQSPRAQTPRAQGTRAGSAAGPQRRPSGPAIPEDADPKLLAVEVRNELRSLSKLNAERVAKHLVTAGGLVDDDPQAALEHARAARATAGRVGAVREAVGITAYHAGEWAEALSELRAARRITGDSSHLPVMADCERALGRPQRALELARSAEVTGLPPELQAEMRIVEAGARRDLGEFAAAVVTLQGPDLDRDRVEPWSPRLWYAYADALLAAGRKQEAYDWFVAVAMIDDEGVTDAHERIEGFPHTDADGEGPVRQEPDES
jgi:hypothetical protein